MVKYPFDFKSRYLSKETLNEIVKAVALTELAGVTSCFPTASARSQITPCTCTVKTSGTMETWHHRRNSGYLSWEVSSSDP